MNQLQDIKNNNEDLVFFIRIQYRCNTSWQGTIQWMDGRKTAVFRSVLELGNLINSAKQQVVNNGENINSITKWEDKESVS